MTNTTRRGKKWSEFSKATTVTGSATLNFEESGQNKTITVDNFASQLQLADLVVAGVGVPVLEIAGSTSNIRSLESTGGMDISVGPQNNIQLRVDLSNGVSGGAEVLVDPLASPIVARTLIAGSGISLGQSGDIIQIATSGAPSPTNIVVVNSLSDFPTPVGDVITLADSTVYFLSGSIDILGNRFVAGDNTLITGSTTFIDGIVSTTTGDLFSTVDGVDFGLRDFFIDAPMSEVFSMSAPTPKTGRFSVDRVNVLACDSIGIVNNYALLLLTFMGIEQTTTTGLTVSGSNAVINIDSVLVSDFIGTMFDLNGSTSDVINIENTTIISTNPANIIIDGLPNSGNINAGGAGVLRAINILGAFTSTGNINSSDISWEFSGSNVLQDSNSVGLASMSINNVQTPIIDSVPVKVAGVWVIQSDSRFTVDTTGRITYIGNKPLLSGVMATFTVQKLGGGTEAYVFNIALNGSILLAAQASLSTDSTRDGNLAITFNQQMVNGDYIELFATGILTSNNVIVYSANLNVRGI